jgi:hypothetical protein
MSRVNTLFQELKTIGSITNCTKLQDGYIFIIIDMIESHEFYYYTKFYRSWIADG